uniref:Uncharacterized protein n=1 Tax=Tanacetum cinerariifolium TaxID=118510 RepID=A0A699QAL2_TANCI|nr:hypothetical protein [Tanacetum cinerariifolium]
MPGPEEPEQAPPSPDYVLGPEHADDEIVAEDQPYAEDTLPMAQSPEYVPESDFEMHPEDDATRTLRRILLIILLMEEMTAMTKRTADQAPSAEETEPFETDESAATPPPHPAYHTTARILFQHQYLCQHGLIQRLLDFLLYLPHLHHHYPLGLHHHHGFLFQHYP